MCVTGMKYIWSNINAHMEIYCLITNSCNFDNLLSFSHYEYTDLKMEYWSII